MILIAVGEIAVKWYTQVCKAERWDITREHHGGQCENWITPSTQSLENTWYNSASSFTDSGKAFALGCQCLLECSVMSLVLLQAACTRCVLECNEPTEADGRLDHLATVQCRHFDTAASPRVWPPSTSPVRTSTDSNGRPPISFASKQSLEAEHTKFPLLLGHLSHQALERKQRRAHRGKKEEAIIPDFSCPH